MLFEMAMLFAGCFILERLFAGWKLPKVKTWPLRGPSPFNTGVALSNRCYGGGGNGKKE